MAYQYLKNSPNQIFYLLDNFQDVDVLQTLDLKTCRTEVKARIRIDIAKRTNHVELCEFKSLVRIERIP